MRRIIEDVMALPRVLDVVIAARGCVVQMRSSGTCGMVAAVKESARRAEKSAPTSSLRLSLLVFLISLILQRPRK